MHLTLIAGARPNFMKIAAIVRAVESAVTNGSNIEYRIVHTGQHYDTNMSGSFFEQLSIPTPDIDLGCGGGTHAEQTANIMVAFEKDLLANPTDLVVVVGDVNSTLACSVVAKKLNTRVAHVEGGIRSGDLTMPEEINRIVTDSITDYFFTTSETANHNLKHAGIPGESIHFVGNTMIDTLLSNLDRVEQPVFWDNYGLTDGKYLVLTLHRPNNVDDESNLSKLLATIAENSQGLPVIFPAHPRTLRNMDNIKTGIKGITTVDPMGYLQFIYLIQHAKAVITDSGGITEEATVLGIPCMTLRDSTERPETVDQGTNELLGTDPKTLPAALEKLFLGRWKKGSIPPLWDGNSGDRIIEIITKLYS